MSTILHTIYGRLLGVDKNKYITGEKGIKSPNLYVGSNDSEVAIFGSTAVQAATSATTGTVLNFGGYITLTSSSTSTWNIAAPAPGRDVFIQRLSTTTASTQAVTLVSGTIITSTQVTATTVSITGAGGIVLRGLSTAVCAAMPFSTLASNAALS